MSTEGHSQADPPGDEPALGTRAARRPRSSKMLESYLGDIEYLLRECRFADAAPLALALPHICVALGHPDLVSSRAAYLEWCESWVRPPCDDTAVSAPSPVDLDRLAVQRGVEHELSDGPGVPAQGLRQLRLRRLSRAAPLGRGGAAAAAAGDAASPGDETAREACVALLAAVRRWYRDLAARDDAVQTNLARLAVLR
jgi:hypothetical protein